MAEFLALGSVAEAARRAGYSAGCARATGYRILRHPEVQKAVTAAEADRLAELRVTADRLDAKLAAVAFAQDAAELEQLGCTGRDQLNAIKLLLERLGVLEQHVVIESKGGRIGLYTPGAPVDLDAAAAAGVTFLIPKNGRDSGT